MVKALTYQIDGNNEGGKLHAKLLVKKFERRDRNLTIVLNDIEPGRSNRLAEYFEEHGIAATSHESPAALNPEADIQTLCVDSPSPVVPILEGPVSSSVLEIGQLISPSANEGSVFGVGAVLNRSDRDRYSDSLEIFSRFAALAPERRTSRVMSEPIRHSVQMAPTRMQVHQFLTDKSTEYINGGSVSGELRVFDGLTHASYPIVAEEAGRHMKRRDLKAAAIHDLAPQAGEGSFGIAFYDRAEAWLYVVLGKQIANRRRVMNAIEIPKIEPVAPPLQIAGGWSPPLRQQGRSTMAAAGAAALLLITD